MESGRSLFQTHTTTLQHTGWVHWLWQPFSKFYGVLQLIPS